MLPQLTDLPSIPSLPAIPTSLPLGWLPAPHTASSAWPWVAMGAVLALAVLWGMRRAKRIVIATAITVTGLVLAWNAGLLPSVS